MGFFNLDSWLAQSPSSPPSTEAERTDEIRHREAMICTRDHGVDNELSELLAERGYECSSHRNPRAVRFAANRTPPDLVVIDWRVGEPNAVKLASTLNSNPDSHVTSILALVPSEESDALGKILELGFNDFVMLPLDRAVLAARLGMIESRMRELDQMQALQKDIGQEYQRFLIASGGIGDGIWDLDLATETVHLSDRWKEMLGYQKDEIEDVLEGWLSRVHPEDLTRLRAIIDASIAGEVSVIEQRYRMQMQNGDYRWMLTRAEVVKNEDGKAIRIVGRQTDVDEEDESREAVRTSGLQDSLTRLPNRTVLMDRMHHAFARAQRDSEQSFAVLFFDLDRFKNVNDSLGHITGDKLLRAIAKRVEKACRPGDTVARFGGDEFVILVEDIKDIRAATVAAERIQEEFRVPFDLDGIEVFTTISIGIALWNSNYKRPEDLLRDSDTAMYRAKAMGRNSFAVFDDDMHSHVVAILHLENDLRRALAREEFRVFYQPILSVASGRIAGFEALVRWQHPERGLLLPGEFIMVAEEMGAIIQLDRWVDLILRNSGLYGQSLKLEVTESVLMENAQYASAVLEQLRSLNIAISIDDFGTGYSSLAYLRRFEIDTLKIDYSFISRMLEDEDSFEIVKTIIIMAKNLGKDTVAEGVETRSQLDALIDLDIDMIQGFFVAPALPAEVAESVLERTADSPNHLEKILSDRMDGTASFPATNS